MLKKCIRCYGNKSTLHGPPPKLCVVGSGPAGFYTAQYILKHHSNVIVDIYDRLPVPFGLVRYGVAPDHPEVKNVINTFTKTLEHNRCTFIGNVNVGEDISIPELMSEYHGLVLTYGSTGEPKLNIPGEKLGGIYSAKEIVGWYNADPGSKSRKINLNSETAVVIGQGNVALDVARILLSPVDILRKTDIPDSVLDDLVSSRIRRVVSVGRRGPLQIAATLKELRELFKLPDCSITLDKSLFDGLEKTIHNLPRPRRRLTQLLFDTAASSDNLDNRSRNFELKFFRKPLKFVTSDQRTVSGVEFSENFFKESATVDSDILCQSEFVKETLECSMVIKSIGYANQPLDGVPFNSETGVIPNRNGRVIPGMYCSGWVKSGPKGVIINTMNDSFETGDCIVEDLSSGIVDTTMQKRGSTAVLRLLKSRGSKPVLSSDWTTIDHYEQSIGKEKGKPRDKLKSVEDMLSVAFRK